MIEDIRHSVGRPQTVTVDLTGKFLSVSREVRIVTNMRILWDQILVDTSRCITRSHDAARSDASATLRWRGFSREGSNDGREPFSYDYQQVSFTSPEGNAGDDTRARATCANCCSSRMTYSSSLDPVTRSVCSFDARSCRRCRLVGRALSYSTQTAIVKRWTLTLPVLTRCFRYPFTE